MGTPSVSTRRAVTKPRVARGQRTVPPRCDEVDRRLIELLRHDARTNNRLLGEETGLSAWTVGNRLRRLRRENLLAMTVLVDWRLAGFETSAYAFLRVEDASRAERVLRHHSGVHSLVRTLGGADLIAHVLAEGVPRLREVSDELADTPGVTGVSLAIAASYHCYDPRIDDLPVRRWKLSSLPGITVPLDRIDRRMIECLADDGHRSNREVAKRVGVSEGTIRSRLRRLEESGFLRVVAKANPFALGEATIGYFGLEAPGRRGRNAIERIAEREDVGAIASCLGAHDAFGILVKRSEAELGDALEELPRVRGVRSLTAYPILETRVFRSYLGRIL